MSETALATIWEFYDAERHAGQGGNYIFLLKAFGNAPYYSGETQNFAGRLSEHKKLFAAGGRTFMRRPFIDESTDRSHKGFAARWHHYKQQDGQEQQRLVWVPIGTDDDKVAGSEGATFWASEVTLLVSARGTDRHAIEKRIQIEIMDYYDGLLGHAIGWCLPKRSRLVGHGPGTIIGPRLSYQHAEKPLQAAKEFFGRLEGGADPAHYRHHQRSKPG